MTQKRTPIGTPKPFRGRKMAFRLRHEQHNDIFGAPEISSKNTPLLIEGRRRHGRFMRHADFNPMSKIAYFEVSSFLIGEIAILGESNA